MPAKMIVIAGPPGSGKSSIFPVSSFGVLHFNADDRAADLNGGSYLAIPSQVRTMVNREFEEFVMESIATRTSFAIETTLCTTVTFEQVARAKAAGFKTEMRYLALRDFSVHLERVKARADAGGQSASEATLRSIYKSSLDSLSRAGSRFRRSIHRAVVEMDDLPLAKFNDNPVDGACIIMRANGPGLFPAPQLRQSQAFRSGQMCVFGFR